jgi:hypothetical protein
MLSNRFHFGTEQRYRMFRILKRDNLWPVYNSFIARFFGFFQQLFGFVASIPFVAGVTVTGCCCIGIYPFFENLNRTSVVLNEAEWPLGPKAPSSPEDGDFPQSTKRLHILPSPLLAGATSSAAHDQTPGPPTPNAALTQHQFHIRTNRPF